jgi:hypothetical protein
MSFTKPVPKPTRETPQREYRDKAIAIASKIATFDGKCGIEGCNHTRKGEWEIVGHHIIHRKYAGTCADPENLFPCCVPCHSRIHHNETEFLAWFDSSFRGIRSSLIKKSVLAFNIDWSEVYEKLLEQYKLMLEEKLQKENLNTERA